MGGYMGKLLRVDLTRGSITDESLPTANVLRKYIGGLGLGARIIYDEVPLHVAPFDPENRLVFTTGVLTGTAVPGSSDWTVTSIRPDLDGMTIQGSHSHGKWGAFLKMNGYDGIIVQGAAAQPTYMWVHDGKAELRDASHLWGMGTHDTEDAVLAEIPVPHTVVATIGPAGENLVRSAMIENEKHNQASKGMGSIMGAKRLKAIAVTQGPYAVPISKPREFLQAALTWRDGISGKPRVPRGRPAMKDATPEMIEQWPPIGAAVKNLSDPEWAIDYRAGLAAARLDKADGGMVINRKGCWACPNSCGYRVQVTTGPHTGYVAAVAPGGEGHEGATGMAGVKEPGTVFYIRDQVEHLGMDSAPIGCSLGVAFEAYEKGILTKEKTGGLELRWGDAEMVERLWRMAVDREGFGAILAEGPKKTAEYIGEEALDMVVHIKGTSPNIHDWRSMPGVILSEATTPAGPCWQAGWAPEAPEPDLGNPEGMEPWEFEGKGRMVSLLQRRATFDDSEGVCWFTVGRGQPGSLSWAAQAIAAATGWDFTTDEVLEVGERIMTLQRVYAMRRGLTKADDLDVSPRLLEPPKVGLAAGLTIAPYLKKGVEEFYEAMGWDRETGKPLPKTLRKLGLEDILRDLPR